MKIIIPMSGIGKRFIEKGYKEPKPLIVVDGKPVIQHVVERFDRDDDFIFICSNHHLETTEMRQVLQKICPRGKIIGIDPHKLGPVFAVLQVLEHIADDEPCIVNYCDFSWRWDYDDFRKTMKETGCDGCVVSYKGFHPHLLGPNTYASMKENEPGWMEEIREKHSFTPDKMDCYQSSGTYYFKKGEYIKKYFRRMTEREITLNGEYYVSLVYNLLKEDGLNIYIYEIPYFLQWGTPEDLKEYEYWSEYFHDKKN
jgi:NDP-sugar pyrophosphorylase family protein